MTISLIANILKIQSKKIRIEVIEMKELIVAEAVNRYIKDYLKATGKKQAFLAREIGYDPKTFSLLINGRKPMKIDDLINICSFFREPASTFITNETLKMGA